MESAAPASRRISSSRRRQRRRRRIRRLLLLGGVAVLVAVGAGLLWADLIRARNHLNVARQALQQAADNPTLLRTPEGRAATRQTIDTALASVERARRGALGSRLLSAGASVPGLRSQRSGLLQLIEDVKVAAVAGRDLLTTVDSLASEAQLRAGHIPFDRLLQLHGHISQTAVRLQGLARSSAGLWGPVGDARRRFDDVVRSNTTRLTDGADALFTATRFLGASEDRRYLVALQNNAEMRDQGMVLSYLVADFGGGGFRTSDAGSVIEIALDMPAPTPVPPGTDAVFGSILPTQLWQSVNATADFGWSGRAMLDMYRQVSGESVDGVIAIDVPGLAALLRVVGPVAVDGVAEPIHADNVGRVLLHDFYQGIETVAEHSSRRERQADVAEIVVDRLATGNHDVVALGRELADAAAGGHLRLWSADPGEEEIFERTGLGGGPASKSPERTFHLAVQSRTATKVDYFVKPSVRQEVRLTEAGDAQVRTTVIIDNQAPPGSQPSYALGPEYATDAPGDYVAWVVLWSPSGSKVPSGIEESGLVLSQYVFKVPAGGRQAVSFETVVPKAVRDGRVELRLVPQPRLEPVPLEVVFVDENGWEADGTKQFRVPWDRVMTLGWAVHR